MEKTGDTLYFSGIVFDKVVDMIKPLKYTIEDDDFEASKQRCLLMISYLEAERTAYVSGQKSNEAGKTVYVPSFALDDLRELSDAMKFELTDASFDTAIAALQRFSSVLDEQKEVYAEKRESMRERQLERMRQCQRLRRAKIKAAKAE